jgi:hypothetical protein
MIEAVKFLQSVRTPLPHDGLTPSKNNHHLNTHCARSTVIKEHFFQSYTARLLAITGPDLEISSRELCTFLYLPIHNFMLLKTKRKVFTVVTQSVSHQVLIAETWVHFHPSQCGICGGNSGMRKVFIQELRLYPVSIIPLKGNLRIGLKFWWPNAT